MPHYTDKVLHGSREIARAESERIYMAMEQGKKAIPAGFDHTELEYEMVDIYGQMLSGPVESQVRFN